SGSFLYSGKIAIINGVSGPTSLQAFNTSATGDQTFNDVISGTGSYIRTASAAGTGANTIFNAANTYSGGTTLTDGGIGVGIDSAGTPPAIISGAVGMGTVTVSPSAGRLPTLFSSGGGHVLGNAINLANTTAPLIINGANTLTLSGLITGPGSLSKSGAAQLRLSPTGGNNSYSGGTVITGGEIAL